MRPPSDIDGRTITEMWEHQRVDERTGQLPQGTVTFLFTDIEGSTGLAEMLGETWPAVVATHHELLRRTAAAAAGVVVSTEGDSFFIVFEQATSAIRGAVEMQRAIARQDWPGGVEIRVRMGLHTGDAILGGDDYAGLDVNRAARISASGHGGQILTSAATRELTESELAPAIRFRDLGE